MELKRNSRTYECMLETEQIPELAGGERLRSLSSSRTRVQRMLWPQYSLKSIPAAIPMKK